jgi:hypothetical protein
MNQDVNVVLVDSVKVTRRKRLVKLLTLGYLHGPDVNPCNLQLHE